MSELEKKVREIQEKRDKAQLRLAKLLEEIDVYPGIIECKVEGEEINIYQVSYTKSWFLGKSKRLRLIINIESLGDGWKIYYPDSILSGLLDKNKYTKGQVLDKIASSLVSRNLV